VYSGLLEEDADDGYVLTALGNLYRLAGEPETAAQLYARALAVDPANLLARRLLAQAGAEPAAAEDAGEAGPLTAQALRQLAQRLKTEAGRRDEAGREEIRGAADMLENFYADEQTGPAGVSAESVQRLMPALIEMNIRHARAIGRPDLAEALRSLQINVRRQTGPLRPRNGEKEEK